MRSRVETDDLYLGAYLLAEGATLDAVRIEDGNGRGQVLFAIRGEDLGERQADYFRGTATANVARLKAALNHLKDLMFARLREERRRQDDRDQGGDRASEAVPQYR